MLQIQTPHRPVELLSAGEYHKGSTYKTWRPKGTDDWLMILTVEGRGVAASGDHEVRLRSRSVVLFRPQVSQAYQTDDRFENPEWRFLWAHLRPSAEYVPWLAWPEAGPGFHYVADLPKSVYSSAAEALRDAVMHLMGGMPVHEALAKNAAERAMLHIGAHCREQISTVDPRIQQAVRFITGHLERTLTLKEMAGAAGMSVSHFCHMFPEQMEKSPLAFVEELRMRRAAIRLRLEDAPVSEIAYGLGYNCPFYFTNRFRKCHGLSPTAYRRKFLRGAVEV